MTEDSPFYDETFSALSSFALFHGVDKKILDAMLKDFTYVTLKKSMILDDEIGMKYFHIILKGRLKVTEVNPQNARTITLFLLKEGDVYDIFPLLDGKEHIAQPIVVDDMTVLRVPLEQARKWLKIHPEFNRNFLPYIGQKMRELETFSKEIVFGDTLSRLASLILKNTITTKDDEKEHQTVKLINDLSHESLAEMIGSVRSVVSTQMQHLKDDKIIAGKKGTLIVKDLEKLKKKCDLFI